MKKMTKLVSIIAAMAIASSGAAMCVSADDTTASVTTSVTAPVTTNPFADTYDKWYEDAVAYVYTHGLIKGVSDTEFKPEADVTGSELATILYRIYCLENGEEADDTSVNWDEPAKKWVEENKLAEGITAFDFSKALKREEIMTLVYNSYKLNHEVEDPSDMILSQFADGDKVSEYAKTAARWNVEKGIIQGDDKNSLLPDSNVTRAETAAVIMRYIENCELTFNQTDGPGAENPMVEYKTLAEAEKASGLKMPELKVDKYTAEGYYTISETEQANAILGETGTYNGKAVTVRCGMGDRDISGIQGGETLEGGLDGVSVSYKKYGDIVYADWARLIDGKVYCYSVAIEKGTADELNTFIKVIGADEVTANGEQIPNPMVEYKTLAEAEKASGLTMPEFKVDKYTVEKYFTISEDDEANAILQEEGKYDGKNIVVRYGMGDRAIAGFNGAEAMDEVPDGISVSYQKLGDIVSAEWAKTVDGKVYCYSVAIEGGTADDLTVFVNAIGAEQVVKEQ